MTVDGVIYATCPGCDFRVEADSHDDAFRASRAHWDAVHVQQKHSMRLVPEHGVTCIFCRHWADDESTLAMAPCVESSDGTEHHWISARQDTTFCAFCRFSIGPGTVPADVPTNCIQESK